MDKSIIEKVNNLRAEIEQHNHNYYVMDNPTVVGAISKASASALILFAIIMSITAVELWVSKKKVHF